MKNEVYEMLSLINKLPNYFRWMLFIPLFFVSYLLFNKFLSFSLTPVFGLYDENDPFTFIAYNLYLNTISTALAIICSAFFAPKLRRIVALSLVLFIALYFLAHIPFILSGLLHMAIWKLLFSMLTMLLGGFWGVRVVYRKTVQLQC
ncbi:MULTISPECIES: hypothetical protein [Oceanobacillus]|uniref:Uncharacterized protein n=1 Tax=Oceanobacillus profundus TaxID=372463 RepID=A0A417YBY1_9BACI|nr:hypothetical protein [Oceanobacillus profundus]MBR3118941.1 hypothetical protein [Oceanobacillus sp.]PAE27851.1 hypothetical protein CHI07_17720 [Paenibacillus sp. 7884-2]RHW30027.1 hypothetical protein D1B32_19455 [Oceanobacillus profundus]